MTRSQPDVFSRSSFVRADALSDSLESRLLFASVTATLLPTQDAFVRDGTYASINAGKDVTLAVKKDGTSAARRSYLLFNTASSAGNVTKATLRTYGKLSTTGTATTTVALYAVPTTTWSESTITWNNKPPANSTAITSKAIGTTAGWKDWDVTAYLKAQRTAGKSAVSFCFVATTSNAAAVTFSSEEASANKPALVLTTEVPVPAAPTGVVASAADLRINVRWQPVANATSYNVFRLAEPDVEWGFSHTLVATGVTATSWIDFTSVEQMKFRYVVSALNASGESAQSAEVSAITGVIPAALPFVAPMNPIGLEVQISAGTVQLPDGSTVSVRGGSLELAAPQIVSSIYTGPAPQNYFGTPVTQRWPDKAAGLVPPTDAHVFGGLYRAVLPASVVVRNAAGQVMTRDVDYKLNEEWGQVANLTDRLGAAGTGSVSISFRAVLQRLDLVQVMSDGSVSLKEGESAVVCPVLPTPDAGAVALAGIHVYTLDGARTSGFTIQSRDIYAIRPAAPVAPINRDGLSGARAKLAAGQPLNIAFFGDSITAGAEVPDFSTDRRFTYTQRVVDGLKSRYPQSTVSQVMAHESGISMVLGAATFQKYVLDPHNAGARVDLVVIAMGMNDLGKDATGAVDLSAFNNALSTYIAKAREKGTEVLLVTPMQSNVYYEAQQTERVSRATIAQAIRDMGQQTGVAVADVHTEWMNQATRGVSPFSQLHNGFNHPGISGMEIYADTILRHFE